ncbi:hypothetical protein EDF82_0571 [Raoultella sp. BIGb0399]|nr:hypothetical protein EDF82_0571 [Raoultella sp. BIGb0399]
MLILLITMEEINMCTHLHDYARQYAQEKK